MCRRPISGCSRSISGRNADIPGLVLLTHFSRGTVVLDHRTFRIQNAARVRWEWFAYGLSRPATPLLCPNGSPKIGVHFKATGPRHPSARPTERCTNSSGNSPAAPSAILRREDIDSLSSRLLGFAALTWSLIASFAAMTSHHLSATDGRAVTSWREAFRLAEEIVACCAQEREPRVRRLGHASLSEYPRSPCSALTRCLPASGPMLGKHCALRISA